MIERINAIVIPVSDVKGCALFYRDKLGFRLPDLQEEEAYLSVGEGNSPVLALKSIGLVAKEIPGAGPRQDEGTTKRTHLVAFVTDVDAECAALKSKGVSFVDEATTKEDGWRTAHFEDPEGNLWELAQRPGK